MVLARVFHGGLQVRRWMLVVRSLLFQMQVVMAAHGGVEEDGGGCCVSPARRMEGSCHGCWYGKKKTKLWWLDLVQAAATGRAGDCSGESGGCRGDEDDDDVAVYGWPV